MKNRRNYYRLLQVQPDAPAEIIHASFRTLMKDLRQHPDLGGSADGAALLTEAFRILSDPIRRAGYDAGLFARYSKRVVSAAAPGGLSSCGFCKSSIDAGDDAADWCPTCHTPTRSTSSAGEETASRRAMGRTTRRARIHFWTRWPQRPQKGTMVNLSPGGMRFLCRERLVPGMLLKISGPGFEASAVVRNVRSETVDGESLNAVGAAFATVDFERSRGSFLSASA